MSQADRTVDLDALLAKFRFSTPIRVRFCETDANRHVNQVSYFVYVEQARMDYFDHEAGRSTPLTPAIREAIARLEGLPI